MAGLCCLSWECTWAARLQAGMRLMHTEPVGVSLFQSHRRGGAAAGEEQAPARTAMWQGCCSQDWALGKAGRGGMGQRACGSTSPVPQQGSGTDSLHELIPLWPGYSRTLAHNHTDRGVQSVCTHTVNTHGSRYARLPAAKHLYASFKMTNANHNCMLTNAHPVGSFR